MVSYQSTQSNDKEFSMLICVGTAHLEKQLSLYQQQHPQIPIEGIIRCLLDCRGSAWLRLHRCRGPGARFRGKSVAFGYNTIPEAKTLPETKKIRLQRQLFGESMAALRHCDNAHWHPYLLTFSSI